jgi:hypothetical protein
MSAQLWLKTANGGDHLEGTGVWKDSIKMVLNKIEWEGVEQIRLAQYRDAWGYLVNTIMNFWVL